MTLASWTSTIYRVFFIQRSFFVFLQYPINTSKGRLGTDAEILISFHNRFFSRSELYEVTGSFDFTSSNDTF